MWGFSTPTTVGDFGWYFNLQNIHNFGGDIISDDFSAVTIDSEPVQQATQYAVDLICTEKVQPPLGQYDREGGIELFKAGKLAFLLDEPLRVEVFQEEGLPFEWDIAQPVGAPDGTQTQFSTTGHWSIGAKSDNKDAAWELVKYLSGQEFMTVFNSGSGSSRLVTTSTSAVETRCSPELRVGDDDLGRTRHPSEDLSDPRRVRQGPGGGDDLQHAGRGRLGRRPESIGRTPVPRLIDINHHPVPDAGPVRAAVGQSVADVSRGLT